MTAVHQVIAAAAPADAVTGQALRLRALLRGWGHGSEIVAAHVHPALAGQVLRLDTGGRRVLDEGALVLRYSIWSAAAEAALASDAPLAVVYHNVTPGHLLRAANPAVADLCDAGRARLPSLGARAAVLIADSSFNAADLRAAGAGEAAVVPLLLDTAAPPDRTAPPPGPPSVVTVGRVVPNKRLEDVVRVVTLLQRSREPEARLVVVGAADGFEGYLAALRAFVERLGVRNVRFAGRVDDAARDRAYAEASAYLCMSVHEGFCVPVVESMQNGLPVVARAAAAVPETLGAAGLALPDDDLGVFSEAVREVARSAPLRRRLAEAMRDRLAELSPERVAPMLRAALAPVTGSA